MWRKEAQGQGEVAMLQEILTDEVETTSPVRPLARTGRGSAPLRREHDSGPGRFVLAKLLPFGIISPSP